MGVIYYKNKQYASGGSAPGSSSEHIELTYAEYQALSEAEQKNGAVYFITDVDNDGGITGYTGGTGITVSEDKVIAIKDIKKNYIDNSNFRINTRGQSEYTTSDSSIYTVDRWYIDGGILTPVENGIQFTNTNTSAGSSSLIRLKQDIPYTFADLAGKTVTLSAKIDGKIYTGTATIPTEKPTEGTATQYIAVGIPAFGINLNYSITGDYFVPYLALAYSQSVLVEWMKLEVNDKFSGYIEPDYMTELIKMNFTTSDKGALNLPVVDTELNVDSKNAIANKIVSEALATDSLIANLFPVVIEGNMDIQTDDTQIKTEEFLSDRGFYLATIHNTGVPKDGYLFLAHQGNSVEIFRITGDDTYSKVTGQYKTDTSTGTKGIFLTFYSNTSSKMNYKVYKLPFFAN